MWLPWGMLRRGLWFAVLLPLLTTADAQARTVKKKAKPAEEPPAAAAPATSQARTSRVERREEADAPVLVERPVASPARVFVFLGAGNHVDDATMRSRERVAALLDERRDERSGGGPFGALGVLVPWRERLRIGGVARYFGKWQLEQEGNNNQTRSLGYLLGLTGRGEWVLPLVSKLDLTLATEAGALLLFPAGDLAREIDDLQARGVGVWGVPRLGYTVGPEAGIRFRMGERVALRAGFGVTWSQLFLFFTHQDVGDIRYERSERVNLVRYDLAVSLETWL